jgi:hypothetical protein
MDDFRVVISLRFEPTFFGWGDGDIWIRIVSSKEGRYTLLADKMPGTSSEGGYEDQEPVLSLKKGLRAKTVQSILDELDRLEIKAFPKQEMGCDGGFTELEIGGYDGKAVYRWWSATPEPWRPLEEIAWKIRKLSGIDRYLKENSPC